MAKKTLDEMTESERLQVLATLHAQEIAKCRESFEYYLMRWVKTRDEHDAKRPVKRVPDKRYIRFLAHEFQFGPDVQYWAKSRQLMVSWIASAGCLWTQQFRPHARVCFQSKKEEDAQEMVYQKTWNVGRMSFILGYLPDFLRVCISLEEDGTEKIVPIDMRSQTLFAAGMILMPNGSRTDALAQGAAQVESKVPSLYIGDEASLQDEWEYAQAAVVPCISNGGRALTVGTMRLPSAYGEEIATAADVDPDGEMRGIARFRSKSGVACLRIHYTADPDKDPRTEKGLKWFAEESARMPGGVDGTMWQQHMEINPMSVSGERCIPFWFTIKDRVVIPPIGPEQAGLWALSSGLDYGGRNKTVWLVRADDFHGGAYFVHELAIPANEVGGITGICKLMKDYPLFHRLNGRIQADPSLWNKDQNTKGGLVSKAQLFLDEGVILVPAKTKGQEADDIMLSRLKGFYWSDWEETAFEPKLFICANCTNLSAAVGKWMYRDWNDAAQKDHGLQEKMKDKDMDEFDAMKYLEVSRPAPAMLPRAPAPAGSLHWFRNRLKNAELRRANARS